MTERASDLAAALASAPIVAVVRHDDAADAERIARAAVAGGATVVEITFTVPDAPRLIARLSDTLPGIVVGAGTVLTAGQATAAVDAGAAFLVSPVTDLELLQRNAATPFLPGAFTPTEVAAASRAGAYAVKLFPARTLGPGFVTAVRETLPGVRLMPTGGIAPGEVGAWLEAGATAVGIAGALAAAWRRDGERGVQNVTEVAVAAAHTARSTE